MNRFSIFLPFFLVVLFLGAPSRTALGQPTAKPYKYKSYAVLFGVGTFPGTDLGDLPGAINDMTALRENWFNAPEFEGSVFSLVEGGQGPNALEPTRANFEKTLDKLATLTADNDAIYICVATHGVSAFNRSFLCPRDATDVDLSGATRENLDEMARAKGLLAVASLLERLKRIKGRKVLIIDACRENTSKSDESDFLQEFESLLRNAAHGNLAVISSCCLGQFARETLADNGRPRGVFFHAFLEGLNGNAELTGSYDGQITLIEAYNYANQRTKRAAEERGWSQTPELYEANDADNSNGVDRLVLTRRDLFAKTPNAQTLTQESDALFALRVGDALTKTQGELANGVKGDYPLVEELFDYALEVQPSNRLARNLRGYARRAQADYAGALEDFQKIGADLVLYVKADPNEPQMAQLNACPFYASATAPQRQKGNAFPLGTIIVVDKIENGRVRVAFCNSKPPEKKETWISADAVVWSRTQAATTILGTETTQTRNIYNSALTPPPAAPPVSNISPPSSY